MARKRRNTKESERAPPADPCVEPVGCFESTNRTSTLCAPGNRALAFQLRGTRQAESPDGGNRWVSTGPSDVGRSESRSGTTALVTPQGLQSECGSETHAGALARMQQDSETADRRDPQVGQSSVFFKGILHLLKRFGLSGAVYLSSLSAVVLSLSVGCFLPLKALPYTSS